MRDTAAVRAAVGTVYSRYLVPLHLKYLNAFDSVDIHPSSTVALRARLDPGNGTITIGRDCHVHNQVMILPYGGSVTLGDDCTVNPFSVLYGHGGLRIGDGVRIAAATIIIPANHVFEDVTTRIYQQGETREGITIEDDVWIGAGVRVLDGTTIGTGSVVAAGSVVTESVPEHSVVGGVPARVLKSRTDAPDPDPR